MPRTQSVTRSNRVLLLDPLPQESINAFIGQDFAVDECFDPISEAELVKLIQEYNVVCLCREEEDVILTDEVLRSAHRLLAIGVFGVISNQIDIRAAQIMGIPIFTAPYQHQTSVAELIISNIVLLSRQIGDRSKEIHQGNWQKTSNKCTEVRGKTLGLVGYGHVASQLGVMAESLSIKVQFYDTVSLMPIGNAEATSLDNLLATSDFVALNVTQVSDNTGLFGKELFNKMKKGSFLINTSFGNAVPLLNNSRLTTRL